jgi:hypothetical protein
VTETVAALDKLGNLVLREILDKIMAQMLSAEPSKYGEGYCDALVWVAALVDTLMEEAHP